MTHRTRPFLAGAATATPDEVFAWMYARIDWIRTSDTFSPAMKASLTQRTLRVGNELADAAEALIAEAVVRIEAARVRAEDVYAGEDGKCHRRVTVWTRPDGSTIRKFRPFVHVVRAGQCLYCGTSR